MANRIITGNQYRITVLTERLLRLEYEENGLFENHPSALAVCRDFPEIPMWEHHNGGLTIETECLKLEYDEKPFSSIGLRITLKKDGTVWHYGDNYTGAERNLGGTARTLDQTDGFVNLDHGIFGKKGYAVIDDSKTPVFEGEELVPRKGEGIDLYFFVYGTDFEGGLKEFYHLTGKTPMIPRYALGNWWSRYYRYTEESYLELLRRFREEEIPLSVAVIDMDWHLTKVDEKYGSGWTGYTWDPECFPDYRRFLGELKKQKLAATLNLHPADGIRAFEEQYPAVAKRLGIDPATEQPIEHDLADPVYREAYFQDVMQPYEKDGVDFWWIDWQQGYGKKPGDVDPLLLLNHYHYKDQEQRGKRPMIFSRYAGPGSHRYPIGFSGDTHMTWRSLKFQPYFTSTASNVGYGWWSHDIGGHMMGDRNDERLIRWIQYGVFSPIMRIHTSASPFANKEPWTLSEPWHGIMKQFLQLRHRLLPYLYTASYEAYAEDRPMIAPVYHRCPDIPEAYEVPQEYWFGKNLLVGAIAEATDPCLRMAAVSCYIPEGRWTDLFTGQVYHGGEKRKLYRTVDTIPVLLPAGGIVPTAADARENGTDLPEALRVYFGAGEDGSYELYEDDGVSMDYVQGNCVKTRFEVIWSESDQTCEIRILPAEGNLPLIPEKRQVELVLCGAEMDAEIRKARQDVTVEAKTGFLRVKLPEVDAAVGATIKLRGVKLAENNAERRLFEILDRAWLENLAKERIFDVFHQASDAEEFLRRLDGMDEPEILKDAIREVFV